MAVSVAALRDDLELYRAYVAEVLAWHKSRVDRGLDPRCGLRLQVPGSATVVADADKAAGETPFACFWSGSTDVDRIAISTAAASDLVAYASAKRAPRLPEPAQ